MSDRTITTIAGLIDAKLVPSVRANAINEVVAKYAVAVTSEIADRIDASNSHDPLARQFIPSPEELNTRAEETADPISDDPFSPVPGIVHRYRNRALLKVVNICPVYCRFCFRREMVGPNHGSGLSDDQIDQALAYVRAHPEIKELIVTGGDPLILSPRRLRDLTIKIGAIGTIEKIRWHTRVPIVMPDKINDELIAALSSPSHQVRIAIHANHPNEFGAAAQQTCVRLQTAGFELLSQSVLLRDINDDVPTLANLMQKYAEVGARPYYLHHGDLAPGTSHFRTTIAVGLALMQELNKAVSASLMPQYILDVPGGSGKVALTKQTCAQQTDGSYLIQCRDGSVLTYRDVV